MNNFELNENNFFIYAAKHYYNPLGLDYKEFQEDLNRIRYIKRLINRFLNKGDLTERLILNHLIVFFNVFGIDSGKNILEFKFEDEKYWEVLKPFLLFLRYIKSNEYEKIKMNDIVINRLRHLK